MKPIGESVVVDSESSGIEVSVSGFNASCNPFHQMTKLIPISKDQAHVVLHHVIDIGAVLQVTLLNTMLTSRARAMVMEKSLNGQTYMVLLDFSHDGVC